MTKEEYLSIITIDSEYDTLLENFSTTVIDNAEDSKALKVVIINSLNFLSASFPLFFDALKSAYETKHIETFNYLYNAGKFLENLILEVFTKIYKEPSPEQFFKSMLIEDKVQGTIKDKILSLEMFAFLTTEIIFNKVRNITLSSEDNEKILKIFRNMLVPCCLILSTIKALEEDIYTATDIKDVDYTDIEEEEIKGKINEKLN